MVQDSCPGLSLLFLQRRYGQTAVLGRQKVRLAPGGKPLSQGQGGTTSFRLHQQLPAKGRGTVLPSGEQHRALSQLQGDPASVIGPAAGDLPGCCHIHHGHADPSPRRGGTVLSQDGDLQLLHRGVAGGDILHGHPFLDVPVLGRHMRKQERCLLPAALDKSSGVHHHCPGGGIGEPSPVQDRFRLTSPQVSPGNPVKGLHPGVVVVAVGPPRHIHLPGSNAHAAQGCHQEGGLLPAASEASLVHLQGGRRPAVGGAVSDVLRAPAVHL